MDYIKNKTGLQPVSRPVEQILGFYPKGLSAKMCSKNKKAAQKHAIKVGSTSESFM